MMVFGGDDLPFENPGPNMTFCVTCGCYRLLWTVRPIGDNAATSPIERACAICGEVCVFTALE